MEKAVGRYMIKSPFWTGMDSTAEGALEMMRALMIRHLPVVEDEELRGLVSERDLREAAAKDPALRIADVMKTEIYVAKPETPLNEVIGEMIDQKIGSVLVVSDAREVLGIFTTIDALHVLADFLNDDPEGDDFSLDEYFEEWTFQSEGG